MILSLNLVNKQLLGKLGGIGVFIKSQYFKYVTNIDTECEYILWFKLDKTVLNYDEHFNFGVIYVPPDNTKFFSRDIYDIFSHEIENFTTNNKNVILVGDFNARTGLLSELLSADNFIYDQIGLNPSDVLDIDLNQSIACKISLSRSS